jgi:hypothetical protein
VCSTAATIAADWRSQGHLPPLRGRLGRSRTPATSAKKLAIHAAELERKLKELESMRKTLSHLIHCCQGDHRPECSILQDLEEAAPAAPARPRKSA